MRNHHEKARDMARSVLPSTRRRGARQDKAAIRSRERARLRVELHELRRCADPDDFEGDLTWEARSDRCWMVLDRRAADKVGPLTRWAARTVENDPDLAAAPLEERLDHFRRLLPDGLIGAHALSHLWWDLGGRDEFFSFRRSRQREPGATLSEMVADLVALGLHGELNRRIRAEVPGVERVDRRIPAHRVVDDDHPPPGRLVPARTVTEYEPSPPRFLAGAHDVDAFVADAGWGEREVVRALHAEHSGGLDAG